MRRRRPSPAIVRGARRRSSTTIRTTAKIVDHARPQLYDRRQGLAAFRARSIYDFGWAELTSITAYRYNKYTRGQDADFNNLDILYRDDDGGSYNRFKTFTQELRLQGNAFGQPARLAGRRLLRQREAARRDNLDVRQRLRPLRQLRSSRRTSQRQRAAAFWRPARSRPASTRRVRPSGRCAWRAKRALALHSASRRLTVNPRLPARSSRARRVRALSNRLHPATQAGFPRQLQRRTVRTAASPTGSLIAGTPADAQQRGLNDLCSQTSNNWALFTHNIFSITDAAQADRRRALHAREEDADAATSTTTIALCRRVLATSPFASLSAARRASFRARPGGHLRHRGRVEARTRSRAPRC